MQAIADRAQINKAMLHYHFRSKDELFAQIFKDKAGSCFPQVAASSREQTDFIAFTCDFVDSTSRMLIANPFLPSYLLQVSANHIELLEAGGDRLPAAVRPRVRGRRQSKRYGGTMRASSSYRCSACA